MQYIVTCQNNFTIIKFYQRISVLSCFTVASAKPAVSDFRGGLSIPGINGPGGCDAFVKCHLRSSALQPCASLLLILTPVQRC